MSFYSSCVAEMGFTWTLFLETKYVAEVKVRQTKLLKLTSNLNSAVTFCLPTKDVHLKHISIHSLNREKEEKSEKHMHYSSFCLHLT